MSPQLTVIICTHNPRHEYLNRVVQALQQQTLSTVNWNLLLVDNASTPAVATWLDLSWHPQATMVNEQTLGLTAARQRAFKETQTPVMVFVDDDNVLSSDYLEQVVTLLNRYPQVGAMGGKCLPEFEQPPEGWFQDITIPMGLRDFGDAEKHYSWVQPSLDSSIHSAVFPQNGDQDGADCEVVKSADATAVLDTLNLANSLLPLDQRQYPAFAPIGAGLVIRRQAMQNYCKLLETDARHLALGRTGASLTSGEDNDMMLTLLAQGWAVGYFPQLQLLHLIAARRLDPSYLRRMNRDSCRSWVQVLDLHGLRPWPQISGWTVPLRQFKSYLHLRPWTSTAAAIRWQGACGLLEGQAQLL